MVLQNAFENLSTEAKQDLILTALASLLVELGQKLEPGGTVEVGNFPTEFPDQHPDPQLDALTDGELRALPVDVADSGEREYIHVVATVTASGDTTVYTPAAGKRIVLRWLYAINEPTASSSPLIKAKLGSTEIYRVWALSKRQKVTGGVDAPLVINLNSSGNVAVTALLEEI